MTERHKAPPHTFPRLNFAPIPQHVPSLFGVWHCQVGRAYGGVPIAKGISKCFVGRWEICPVQVFKATWKGERCRRCGSTPRRGAGRWDQTPPPPNPTTSGANTSATWPAQSRTSPHHVTTCNTEAWAERLSKKQTNKWLPRFNLPLPSRSSTGTRFLGQCSKR